MSPAIIDRMKDRQGGCGACTMLQTSNRDLRQQTTGIGKSRSGTSDSKPTHVTCCIVILSVEPRAPLMPNDLHAMVTRTTTQPRAQPAGPCAMAIFGAGGDLTRRLVIPALYNLMANRLLPDEFVLIGVDMAALSTEQWRQRLTEMMQGMLKGDGQLPNHLFQLLTMTAMEPPSSFDPDAVRNRKADTLKAIPPISLDCA